MNHVIRKLQVSLTQPCPVLHQALALCRATPSIQHPLWVVASANERLYRSMPTHGIGRWKNLLEKRVKKKKQDRYQMTPVVKATDTAYGTLNVKVLGYDMTTVEHYTQYIHKLCNQLKVKVDRCYALPTKTTELMLMQERGSKMYVDANIKTHERVVQLNSLDTRLCPVLMDVLLKNQPEGVQLSVKEHTEEDFKLRFKVRRDLEELMAQMNQ